MSAARDVPISELFDELKKANLRAIVAEEKLAAVEALVAKAESRPDQRPRDKYGPIGRASIPTVPTEALRKALRGES